MTFSSPVRSLPTRATEPSARWTATIRQEVPPSCAGTVKGREPSRPGAGSSPAPAGPGLLPVAARLAAGPRHPVERGQSTLVVDGAREHEDLVPVGDDAAHEARGGVPGRTRAAEAGRPPWVTGDAVRGGCQLVVLLVGEVATEQGGS